MRYRIAGVLVLTACLAQSQVRFVRVWSNQLQNDAVVNFLPPNGTVGAGVDSATGKPKQYVLMGTTREDSAEVVAEFETEADTALQQVVVQLVNVYDGSLRPAERAAIEIDWGSKRAFVRKASGTGSPTIFHELLIGIDGNSDRALAPTEVRDRVGLVIVDGLRYASSIAGIAAGIGGWSIFNQERTVFARAFLNHFLGLRTFDCDGGQISCLEDKISIHTGELSHHVGAQFGPDGIGPIIRYRFGRESDLAQAILRSSAFVSAVKDTIRAHREEVLGACTIDGKSFGPWAVVSNEGQCRETGDVRLSAGKNTLNFRCSDEDFDLSKVFGTASLSNGFQVSIQARQTEINRVEIDELRASGQLQDLYDFDFDRTGDSLFAQPALRALAEIQAGFPTLGDAGRVFRIEVDLTGAILFPFEIGTRAHQISVVPAEGMSVRGEKGRLDPGALRKDYSITNTADAALRYSAAASQPWVTTSPQTAVLGAGETRQLTIGLNSGAEGLPVGSHRAAVSLSSALGESTCPAAVRDVVLEIVEATSAPGPGGPGSGSPGPSTPGSSPTCRQGVPGTYRFQVSNGVGADVNLDFVDYQPSGSAPRPFPLSILMDAGACETHGVNYLGYYRVNVSRRPNGVKKQMLLRFDTVVTVPAGYRVYSGGFYVNGRGSEKLILGTGPTSLCDRPVGTSPATYLFCVP